MEEQLSPEEVRPEIIETINFANKILEGFDWTDSFSYTGELLDPSEVFSGPILDLNDSTLTEREIVFVQDWIKEQLGNKPEEAPVKAIYESPDGQTTVTVYDVPLGQGEAKWYLSKWQNEGEEPSYIFWQEDVYEWQVEESGYREIIK